MEKKRAKDKKEKGKSKEDKNGRKKEKQKEAREVLKKRKMIRRMKRGNDCIPQKNKTKNQMHGEIKKNIDGVKQKN